MPQILVGGVGLSAGLGKFRQLLSLLLVTFSWAYCLALSLTPHFTRELVIQSVELVGIAQPPSAFGSSHAQP